MKERDGKGTILTVKPLSKKWGTRLLLQMYP